MSPNDFLPPSIEPRGLVRTQAAAYLGIKTAVFDRLVSDGRMPKPKIIEDQKIWDRVAIDKAFEALPGGEPDFDVWANVRAFAEAPAKPAERKSPRGRPRS